MVQTVRRIIKIPLFVDTAADVVDIPVVARLRMDMVIDVPGVRVQRVPRVPSWRR